MTRAIIADEEAAGAAAARPAADAAAAAGEELEPEAGTSYSLDHWEQAKLLLSGGVAGAFSKSCTAPLARLTILYQASGRCHPACCTCLGPRLHAAGLAARQMANVWMNELASNIWACLAGAVLVAALRSLRGLAWLCFRRLRAPVWRLR